MRMSSYMVMSRQAVDVELGLCRQTCSGCSNLTAGDSSTLASLRPLVRFMFQAKRAFRRLPCSHASARHVPLAQERAIRLTCARGPAGELAPLQCTVAYAAPEVLNAYKRNEHIAAHPAQDVWALGVMVYEALTHSHALPRETSNDVAFELAAGKQQYLWERDELDPAYAKSKLRGCVAACLARDPNVAHLRVMIDHLGQQTALSGAAMTEADEGAGS
jgi:serine/threonine protein kinase